MKKQLIALTLALLVLLSMTAMASTGRYDQQIQQAVSQKIRDAKQLQRVNASVEDGIVTLTGTVGLYQDKLDAPRKPKRSPTLPASATTSWSREKTSPTANSSRNWQRNWPMTVSATLTIRSTISRSA